MAIEFGVRAGIIAAAVGCALVFAWSAIQTVHVSVLGYTSRGLTMLLTGVPVGSFSERLREDIAERRRAQRSLELYADQLSARTSISPGASSVWRRLPNLPAVGARPICSWCCR